MNDRRQPYIGSREWLDAFHETGGYSGDELRRMVDRNRPRPSADPARDLDRECGNLIGIVRHWLMVDRLSDREAAALWRLLGDTDFSVNRIITHVREEMAGTKQ